METVGTVTDSSANQQSLKNPEIPATSAMFYSSFHGPPIPKPRQSSHSDSVTASEKVAIC